MVVLSKARPLLVFGPEVSVALMIDSDAGAGHLVVAEYGRRRFGDREPRDRCCVTNDDNRIHRELLHNQEVFIPTPVAWRNILRAGMPEGLPVPLPQWIALWLDSYATFDVTALGIVRRGALGWMLLPLLRLDGRTLRVHFEDVICEHCHQRCGPSATPDTVAYAGTGYTDEQVWGRVRRAATAVVPSLRWRVASTANALAGGKQSRTRCSRRPAR
jgi:hypothetical protein